MAATIENVLCVELSSRKVRHVFPAPIVVTPDCRAPLSVSFGNSRLKRDAIRAAVADAWPDTYRLNQRLDVQQHDMTKSFLLSSEVVAMFLSVIHQHTGGAKFLQVSQREAVRYVVFVGNGAFEIGNEKDVEIVGYWRPEYLRKKFAQVRRAGRQDLILAVSERLNLERAGIKRDAIPVPVVWFKDRVLPKAVLAVLEG